MKYGQGEQAHLARLFSVVSSGRTRCKGHKLKHKRFCVKIRQKIFIISTTKHRHSLPERLGSLPPWKHPKAVWTCSWATRLQVALAWTGDLDRTPEVPSNLCHFVIHPKVQKKCFRPGELTVSNKWFHWINIFLDLITNQNRLAVTVRPPWEVSYFKVLFPKYYHALAQN